MRVLQNASSNFPYPRDIAPIVPTPRKAKIGGCQNITYSKMGAGFYKVALWLICFQSDFDFNVTSPTIGSNQVGVSVRTIGHEDTV